VTSSAALHCRVVTSRNFTSIERTAFVVVDSAVTTDRTPQCTVSQTRWWSCSSQTSPMITSSLSAASRPSSKPVCQQTRGHLASLGSNVTEKKTSRGFNQVIVMAVGVIVW